MANRYINAAVTLPTTSVTDLYTVPGGCSALIQSVIVANESVSAANITSTWYDSSAAATFTLLYVASIPTGSSGNILDKPLALEAGDKISLQAGTGNAFDVTASILLVDATTSVPVGAITTAALADGAVVTAKLADTEIALYVKLNAEVFG